MPRVNSYSCEVPCPNCGSQPSFRTVGLPFLSRRARYLCRCGVSGPTISHPAKPLAAAALWDKTFRKLLLPDDNLIDQMLGDGLQLDLDDTAQIELAVEVEKAEIERRVREMSFGGKSHDLANYLITVGYRRTSNKYDLISRIERPDFVTVMGERLLRAPADFYVRLEMLSQQAGLIITGVVSQLTRVPCRRKLVSWCPQVRGTTLGTCSRVRW